MDAPPIQYARTEDGVNIAYWTLGTGRLFISTPPIPGTHLHEEWNVSHLRAWYESVSRTRQLVRYDPRGFGLSDRNVTEISLETHVRDLEAVIAKVGQEKIDLFGAWRTSGAAMAYVARHPENVSHLILWQAFADGQALAKSSIYAAMFGMLDADFGAFSEAVSRATIGWSADTDAVRQWAKVIRASGTPEMIRAVHAATVAQDVRPDLPAIHVPTLIVHDAAAAQFSLQTAQDLAAMIPDARLVVRESAPGSAPWVWLEDAIGGFLADQPLGKAWPDQSTIHAILFTDVEASTQLTEQLGDAKARQLLQEHERLTRQALAEHGGTEIKTMGDGFMASFTSASSALDAAIAMQQALTAHFADSDTPLRIRIGINAGEPIEEHDDLYGASVIRAARVMGQAQGGEILVADVVRQLVEGKGYLFSDRGAADLKGFEEAVRLFELRWEVDPARGD